MHDAGSTQWRHEGNATHPTITRQLFRLPSEQLLAPRRQSATKRRLQAPHAAEHVLRASAMFTCCYTALVSLRHAIASRPKSVPVGFLFVGFFSRRRLISSRAKSNTCGERGGASRSGEQWAEPPNAVTTS